jgi:Na+-transporting methylmalonyl-CoA/oxaloacetate decarboxylase gamma subunit
MITRNEELRLVVNSMLASVPALANVLLVLFLFILIFSIMGVSFFKDMFWYCAESSTTTLDLTNIFTKQDCLD